MPMQIGVDILDCVYGTYKQIQALCMFARSTLNIVMVREVMWETPVPHNPKLHFCLFLAETCYMLLVRKKSNSETEVNSERQRFVNNSRALFEIPLVIHR